MPNETLKVSHLRIDHLNPRLRNGVGDQPTAIAAVIETNSEKFLQMAAHIAKHGLDPSNLPIACPEPTDDEFYVVLDGNRRLTALKCLQQPALAEASLKAPGKKKLATAAQMYAERPRAISKVECSVYPSRADAKMWVELRHMGGESGAAMQDWGPREKRNYVEREQGIKAPEMQVLDFVKAHGSLSAELLAQIERKFNITTLQRILLDEGGRSRLGIEIDGASVRLRYPPAQSVKALQRIVADIATRKLPVKEVYSADRIATYTETVVNDEIPKAKQGTAAPIPGERQPDDQKTTKGKKKGSKPPKRERGLIPRGCHLHIPLQKIDKLYTELQHIELEEFAVISSVGLRVLLETTVDHYLISQGLKTEAQLQERGSTLPAKITWVRSAFDAAGLMTSLDRAALGRAADKKYFGTESITTMHGFVHSRHALPSPNDVMAQWSSLRPFFETVWKEEDEAPRETTVKRGRNR